MTRNRIVDFFIVGAMKAGTSSLRAALSQHPRLTLHPREIHYFSHDPYFERGPDWYASHFEDAPLDKLLGEKSADYASSYAAPERMAAHNPNAKVIFMLREPVQRALSQYLHSQRRARGRAVSLEEELERRLYEGVDYYPNGYVFRSQYEKHLRRFSAFFPPSQTVVLVLEEVLRDPARALAQVQNLLGVEPSLTEWPHNNPTLDATKSAFPIDDAVVDRLRTVLAPSIDAVEDLLGRKLPDWR